MYMNKIVNDKSIQGKRNKDTNNIHHVLPELNHI